MVDEFNEARELLIRFDEIFKKLLHSSVYDASKIYPNMVDLFEHHAYNYYLYKIVKSLDAINEGISNSIKFYEKASDYGFISGEEADNIIKQLESLSGEIKGAVVSYYHKYCFGKRK
jgi:hypothetical protein